MWLDRTKLYPLSCLLLCSNCAAVDDAPLWEMSSEIPLPDMVFVKGGEFLMGSPLDDVTAAEYHADEHPRRTVTLPDLFFSRYVITAEEFCAFLNEMGNDGYGTYDGPRKVSTITLDTGRFKPRPGADNCPADFVHWRGASAYCEWLSRETGERYRLPTEAEWEYVARGSELRPWPWGNEEPISPKKARREPFRSASPKLFHGYRCMYHKWGDSWEDRTIAVGSFRKGRTPIGIYDMLSYHAPEWCSDFYIPAPDASTPGKQMRAVRGTLARMANPKHPRSKARRIRHMLSSYTPTHPGRSWTRAGLYESRFANIRVVREIDPAKSKRGQN